MEIKLLMENGQSLTACVSTKELLNLKEAIKTSDKFKLHNVIIDTLEIETAFIDDIEFSLED